MTLVLQNTLTRRPQALVPADPRTVTFYSCGPTVYDDAHIGNFRSFLSADLLRRWIESPWCSLSDGKGGETPGPRRVVHVMNITDVGHMTDDAEGGESGEDRMAVAGRRLEEAKKAGKLPAGVSVNPRDPYAIAAYFGERFLRDARDLGLKVAIEAQRDPSLMPRATGSIAGMIEVVRRLVERGYAYVVGNPGARVVYFDVQRLPSYGQLSGNTLDRLREGEGGRVSAANQLSKRHPADFLLWKEDPSHLMKWPSPWGEGYPGWHIECSAMSLARLVEAEGRDAHAMFERDLPLFDLHSGGEDNIFPHHECEMAQSCAAFNAHPERGVLAAHWFHPRFLLVNGEKMSKSRGNFFTARQLLDQGHEPGALRLELIRTHYRANANFTDQGLRDAARVIERWRRVLEADKGARGSAVSPEGEGARDRCRAEFTRAMNDDLNVAGAIAAVNTWVGSLGQATPADARFMREIDEVLGVLALARLQASETDIGLFAPGIEPDARVIERLLARRDARARRDFAASDAIRDELLAMGYAIKDVPGGKVEVRRAP
ncbi:MAG: cysteine--tRNA ligase [Phycisphaerales bacterium]|nr:cysteine--tRNA ligase [Phycisphaerales bacterium]